MLTREFCRTPRVLEAFYSTPWALLPSKLQEVHAALCRSSLAPALLGALAEAGEPPIAEQLAVWQAEKQAARARASAGQGTAVGVISIYGTITRRMEGASGGTTVNGLTAAFRRAMADPEISSIVLDIDSPGGTVFGVDELAAEIYQGRRQKRILAVANHMAASAAYYLGSQADEFIAAPTSEVGSIGVWALHMDWSRALDREGVTPTLISAGRLKVEGNPLGPLSEDALVFLQSRVDEYYQLFLKAVAKGRGTTADKVQGGFGEGRLLGAKQALKAGLVDRIATLDETLASMGVGTAPGGAGAAMDVKETEFLASRPVPDLDARRRSIDAQRQRGH